MRAVRLRVRATLRRHWVSAGVVAAIVAVVSGAALTLAVGARRTASAPDRYTAALGGDIEGLIQSDSGPPRTAEIAALPGVKSVQAMTFVFAAPILQDNRSVADNALSFAGTRPFASRLIAGRTTDPTKPYEFVAAKNFASRLQVHLGAHFKFVSWTRAQGLHGEGFNAQPKGPTFDAVLVGILDSPDKLNDNYSTLVFSPALLHKDVGTVATLTGVSLERGVTLARLRRELDENLRGGSAMSLQPGRVVSAEIRNAVSAQAWGTWIMAAVVGIAALIALGQLLTRHARLSEADRRALTGLGSTRGQLVAETALRAAVPAVIGVAAGALIAVVASEQFPAGFVRVLEPHPGLRMNVSLLGIGALSLLVGVLGWVGIASVTRRRERMRRSRSAASETIARRVPSPAAATGTRFALTGNDGSTASATGTIVVLALVVAGMVGAAGFAASLDRLVSDRGRFGGNYTLSVGDNSDLTATQLRTALAKDPDIAGMMILTSAAARVGRTTVELVGVEQNRGDLAPRLLAGQLPVGPDEVTLGRVTARQLHVHIGDTLGLTGASSGRRQTFRVVGYAVIPTIGGTDGVGGGALMTAQALLRMQRHPDTTMAAMVIRPEALAGARERVSKLVHNPAGLEDVPGSILNIARVRRIPAFLAALLAALLLMTLFHAVVVSIQSRRRDVAVLRALGADRRWVGRAVHWQASVLTALPLIVGVPLGLVAGSFVFRAFVGRIGAVPDPALPIVVVSGMTIALVALANLVAVVPARRARRLPTAALLKSE